MSSEKSASNSYASVEQELEEDGSLQNSWVIFRLCDREFGLPTERVIQMVNLQRTHSLPDQPEHVRGAINLRGHVITLNDLRIQLDLRCAMSAAEELIKLLEARELDHVNWLKELISSVEEEREFTLTTDPHACAFGKWYDNYKPSDVRLEQQILLFDKPHRQIHKVAIDVEREIKAGNMKRAHELLDRTRNNTLVEMKAVFAETKEMVRELMREIIIITRQGEDKIGYVVDAVNEVRDIPEESVSFNGDAVDSMVRSEYLHGVAQVDDRLIILLDADALLD